jgi:hypothetical protein
MWLLHLGIFVVSIPFVILARQDFGTQPSLWLVSAPLPRWAVVLSTVIFACALINFVLFLTGTQGGSTSVQESKYLLLDHGRLIRELATEEYAAFRQMRYLAFVATGWYSNLLSGPVSCLPGNLAINSSRSCFAALRNCGVGPQEGNEMNHETRRQHETWADFLRATAAFMVVWLHSAGSWVVKYGRVPYSD